MTEVDPLRNALEDSIALSRQDKHEEALKLLNKSIADAIRELWFAKTVCACDFNRIRRCGPQTKCGIT